MADDEQLLADLRDAVRSARDVPAAFIAAGKAAFSWRTVDAELAALAEDSVDGDVLAGTRAEHATVRALSFRASDLSIELEVSSDALLGQLVPPRPGQVEVQGKDGTTRSVAVDESGWFTVRPLPQTMVRLHLQTAGSDVITEWFTL